MGKRRKRKRRVIHTDTRRPRTLTPKQRWFIGLAFLVVFGLSLTPYIVDLIRHPDLGNSLLLACVSIAAIAGGVVVLKKS